MADAGSRNARDTDSTAAATSIQAAVEAAASGTPLPSRPVHPRQEAATPVTQTPHAAATTTTPASAPRVSTDAAAPSAHAEARGAGKAASAIATTSAAAAVAATTSSRDERRRGGRCLCIPSQGACVSSVVALAIASVLGFVFVKFVIMAPLYEPSELSIAADDAVGHLRNPLTPVAIADADTQAMRVTKDEAPGFFGTKHTRQGFFAVAPDVNLFFRAVGPASEPDDVAPPVLVLHGGPGAPPSADGFEGVEAMAAGDGGRTFYYLHQRGCGQSTRPVQQCDYDAGGFLGCSRNLTWSLGLREQIADIERVRRVLASEAGVAVDALDDPAAFPVAIIGHSFGALLAAWYAVEFPAAVTSLVLESPAAMLAFPAPEEVPELNLFAVIRARLAGTGDDSDAAVALLRDFDAWQNAFIDYNTLLRRSERYAASLSHGFLRFYAAATGMKYDSKPSAPGGGPAGGGDGGGDGDSPFGVAPADIGGWVGPGIYLSMGFRGFDTRAALAWIRCPSLIVTGSDDLQPTTTAAASMWAQSLVGTSTADDAAVVTETYDKAKAGSSARRSDEQGELPRVRHVDVPGARHAVHDDAPDAFANVVQRFLVAAEAQRREALAQEAAAAAAARVKGAAESRGDSTSGGDGWEM